MGAICSPLKDAFDAGFAKEMAAVRAHCGPAHFVIAEKTVNQLLQKALDGQRSTLSAGIVGCWARAVCSI